MNRVGLQQLSSSARNSPFGQEKIIGKGAVEPLKVANLKKYQPVVPSPLAKPSSFPVTSGENKENKETQTVERIPISTQTTISVPHVPPRITEEDLTADAPTVNYLRCLADRLAEDLDDELATNYRLADELSVLDEQIRKIDDDTQILLEVLEEIDEENKAHEEGIAHL